MKERRSVGRTRVVMRLSAVRAREGQTGAERDQTAGLLLPRLQAGLSLPGPDLERFCEYDGSERLRYQQT